MGPFSYVLIYIVGVVAAFPGGAMAGKVGLGRLADVIHPYPTQAEAIKHVADSYNRTRLTPFAKKLFTRLMAWWR